MVLVFLVGLLGGALAFYFAGLGISRTGTTVTEKVTERQVYLESSQSITAIQTILPSIVSIVDQEQLNSILSREGKMELACLNGELNCSRLAVILTSDGLVISQADLSGKSLADWVALDQLGNEYQLQEVGQLENAELFQLVKKGELVLPANQRTKFFNLKPILLANSGLIQTGQKILGVKSAFLDKIFLTDGMIISKLSYRGLFQQLDANYKPVSLKFSSNLDASLIFDLSGQLVAVKSEVNNFLLAEQISGFIKRYSVNPKSYGMVDFGLKCLDLNKNITQKLKILTDYGCLVAQGLNEKGEVTAGGVVKGSLAEKAGVQLGDVILEVDNKSLINTSLGTILMNKAVGERLDMVVLRASKNVALSVGL